MGMSKLRGAPPLVECERLMSATIGSAFLGARGEGMISDAELDAIEAQARMGLVPSSHVIATIGEVRRLRTALAAFEPAGWISPPPVEFDLYEPGDNLNDHPWEPVYRNRQIAQIGEGTD